MLNGFEAIFSSKGIFLSVWKKHFSLFYKFLRVEVKTNSGKVRQSFQSYLNPTLVVGSLLQNGLESTLSSKTNVLSVWKENLQFFASFWAKKLKPFSQKMRHSVQNYLIQNMVIGNFLKTGFEGTLGSKAKVLSLWKDHFSVFSKSLFDEFETIFWESEEKRSTLYKSKFRHRKLLRKMFWSYLELKNECSECLKRAFTVFCKVLSDKIKAIFWESEEKGSKLLNSNFAHRKFLRKMFWRYLELKNECFERLKIASFSFFANFWVMKLKYIFWESYTLRSKQFKSKFDSRNFIENCFEATLSSKTNVLSLWKEHFSVIYKCLSDENQITLWESDGKRWKIFQSKSGHTKLPRKWFRSYLELKSECFDESMPLKRAFLRFLQIFEWKIWNHFLEKLGSASKTI